ncbi:MAG: hypothetical protein JNG90_05655 [Planctomycetaceae bacterium]|nr:hypothetical protein [Planctomycetaceae bacterium]
MAALIPELESERGDIRDRAGRRLQQMVAQPELASILAVELRRALLAESASFELRARLTPILERLPREAVPAAAVDLAEIERLTARLDDPDYGTRRTAAERLAWMLGDPAAVCPLLAALRARLFDPELDPGLRRELAPLWRQVRAAWLASDPATWQLPAVSDEQIEQWIAALKKPLPRGWTGAVYPPHEIARQELLDLLARDDYLPKVKARLDEQLRDPLDPATYYLREIHDWTLPGLVAEIWEERLAGTSIATVQYLALGVPCQPEGAERPSLFDRCDDKTAHCLSGNSLSPGDWPVGVAFPSPIAEDKFFHLVNLPTPRHRLAYQANVDRDERVRLQELSRRTLDAYIAQARPLTFSETLMLDKLDFAEVSRFAGPYFLAVDDRLYPPDVRNSPSGRASLHQTICIHLAQFGTRAAVPGIMQALAKERFLKPTAGSPFDWPWMALLSISVHDPWPEVERWLADQVLRTEPLLVGPEGQQSDPLPVPAALPALGELSQPRPIPDVGGSAAAILLARHDLPPWAFRLERVWQPPIDNFDIPACRFVDAADRQRVRAWWSKLAGQAGSEPATSAPNAPTSP